MGKFIFTFVVFFLGTGLLCAQNNFHNTHILDHFNPEYVKGEVLVKFKDEVIVDDDVHKGVVSIGVESIDAFLEKNKATEIEKVFKATKKYEVKYIKDFYGNTKEVPQLFNIYKLKFDTAANVKELAEQLQQDPTVDYAEPNYLFFTMDTYPDDPLYQNGDQWYINTVDAPAAWDSTTSDSSQVIAIIDTGVDWDHPDLDGNIWTNWNEVPGNGTDDDGNGYVDDTRGWDWINNDNDPNDDNSHGTHVAGVAAAESNNGVGITGMAWNARLMPLKMLQSSGSGSSSNLATAIEYASNNGATILNMSLGSYANSGTVENALINAYVSSVLVAAAGNDGLCICSDCFPCGNMYPAAYPFVLGVKCEGSFSNTDPSGSIDFTYPSAVNYEVRAPGVNIMSTIPNGYRSYNGTSMATPIVSGICALAKAHNDTLWTDHLWAKLIFGSENGYVNAYNTLILDLDSIGPDLRFLEYTLTDTLPGCDGDGRADAGETIQLHFTVKNVGGYADSVWTKIHFSEFEDTTTAIIIDSTSYIGDISTWATLTGELSPLEIQIDSNVAHNRDIVFEYEIGCENSTDTIINDLIIKVENGTELSGILDTNLLLTSDRLWLVNNSFRVGYNGTLTIEPGTELIIYSGIDIEVRGNVYAIGTKNQPILITGPGSGFISNHASATSERNFKYVIFQNMGTPIGLGPSGGRSNATAEYCKFIETSSFRGFSLFSNNIVKYLNSDRIISYIGGPFEKNVYYDCIDYINFGQSTISSIPSFKYNIFVDVGGVGTFRGDANTNQYYNNFISTKNSNEAISLYYQTSQDYVDIGPQYWGTVDSLRIQEMIFDFWENNSLPLATYDSILTTPSSNSHGFVWKVELNGINPFDETLDPLGSETVKFDVYFNRAMDTVYAPLVGFGVFEPYLQRIVSDSAHWSPDSTTWTAYYTVGQETGDGINTVHVRNTRDPEGFEVPPEKYRFKFVIQAAGSLSIDFLATPGIGKVDLEWPPANTPDVLGYNLYRKYNLTDTTFSQLVRINEELILDTTYVDYNVIPDTTYNYYYTIVGTDLAESDYSKKVTAKPFSAANGDANGDLVVNVLDITTVIAYMLNQDPQPFLFDAADVNGDDVINVLDIIGIVDIILGKKKLVSQVIGTNTNPAYIYLDPDGIRFKNEGQVAAMQFQLTGQNLEEIRLLMKQQGFEFASGIVNRKLMGILYNFNNRTIPEGMVNLIGIEGRNSRLSWGDIVAGDPDGNYVLVLKDEPQPLPVEDYELRAFPNPFKESVTITYKLPEPATITLQFYNSQGQLIQSIENQEKQAGSHKLEWNGKGVPSGVYYCKLIGKTITGKEFNSEIKMVLIK